MKVFLDSSYIIAYAVPNDSLHKKALLLEDIILNNDCYISNYIINEVITVIGNKTNLEIAKNIYYSLTDEFKILNEYEIENFNKNVMKIYEKYNTKLSFTDSSIIELMNKNKIKNLLTFDNYFKNVENINLIN